MSLKKFLSGIILSILIISKVQAGEEKSTVFQYSIFSPIQLYSEDYNVYGLRLNLLYGENKSIYGVDLGGYNYATGNLYGVQLGLIVCARDGDCSAVTGAGIANLSIGDDGGIAMAGFMNVAGGRYTGLQMACINRAQKFSGVQFGVFNDCDDFYGFQFGIINICHRQSLPFTILINWRF